MSNGDLKEYLSTFVGRGTPLESLNKTDISNAEYIVHLEAIGSRDKDGSTKTRFKGNLKSAIINAEEDFKKVHNSRYVHAKYDVHIKLVPFEYSVPKKYWEEFMEANRSDN